QRQRQPAAQVPHPLGGLGVVGAGGVLRGGRQQLLRARRVQRLHGQLVHPRGQVVGQAERSAGGDQDQAVGPFRDQRAHLEGVGGVVQDDRDRRPRQALVVQLAQPLDLLVGGGAFAEQQLLAGCAEPVQQVQQRVPGGQRRLAGAVGAQVD